MDGPSEKQPQFEENMNALSLQDIIILKMFLEKGNRAGIFLETEKQSAAIVRTKLANLIADVSKRQQELQATQEDAKE